LLYLPQAARGLAATAAWNVDILAHFYGSVKKTRPYFSEILREISQKNVNFFADGRIFLKTGCKFGKNDVK